MTIHLKHASGMKTKDSRRQKKVPFDEGAGALEDGNRERDLEAVWRALL